MMYLESLFGSPVEITQTEFSDQVKQILKDVKKIETAENMMQNPGDALSFVQTVLEGYKSMLEQRVVVERTLRGILRNVCKVSLCRYSIYSGNAIKKSYSYLKEILEKKNADYGNSALKNGGLIGNYVRITDKVSRIESLQKATTCNFESLQDTWLDLAGYSVIGLIILGIISEKTH